MIKKQLDHELIKTLDRDGAGVDKAEYVLGMLHITGKITEDDYLPFLERFAELDVKGSGLLDEVALTLHAESALRDQIQKTSILEQSPAWKAMKKIHQAALALTLPCSIMSLGFFWHSIFGYCLLSGGIVNGLAICIALGSRPSCSAYQLVAAINTIAVIAMGCGAMLYAQFAYDARATFRIDPLMSSLFTGYLDENKLFKPLPKNEHDARLDEIETLIARWEARLLMTVYFSFFAAATLLNSRFIYTCTQQASICKIAAAQIVAGPIPQQDRHS